MKILWHSNAPWTPTGYGQQTKLFAPRIRDLGHDVALSCFYGLEGGMLAWQGMPCYPTDSTRFGKRDLPVYAEDWAQGDDEEVLTITLMDVWALGGDTAHQLRCASWVPVDHDPAPPRVIKYFDSGARPIAMSRFGQQRLQDADLDALYVPHAVDTELMRPIEERAMMQEALGIPKDSFVVGMVANNQGINPPRKAFPQVCQVFAEFQRKHPDAILYLHTEMYGLYEGLNLLALAEAAGIPKDAICVTDQKRLRLGVPAETMPVVYSAFDVLANPSYGEGFGVPIVEAQACGTPVIVTDWTSMPELCGAGWLVEGDPWYDAGHGAFYKCPALQSLYEAFEEAYEQAAGMRNTAREFALGYDADYVFDEHWKPVLTELEQIDVPAFEEVAAHA